MRRWRVEEIKNPYEDSPWFNVYSKDSFWKSWALQATFSSLDRCEKFIKDKSGFTKIHNYRSDGTPIL